MQAVAFQFSMRGGVQMIAELFSIEGLWVLGMLLLLGFAFKANVLAEEA